MRVDFTCPACHQIISAPASLAGVTQGCPKCRAEVTWKVPPRASYFARLFSGWQGFVGPALILLAAFLVLVNLASDEPRTTRDTIRTAIICGLLITLGVVLLAAHRTDELCRKVAALNPLLGKESALIVHRLGSPSLTVREGEVEHCTWESPGYLVVLAFREGVCTGVVREVSAN